MTGASATISMAPSRGHAAIAIAQGGLRTSFKALEAHSCKSFGHVENTLARQLGGAKQILAVIHGAISFQATIFQASFSRAQSV